VILNLEKLILRTVDRRLSIICKYHKNKKVSASTTENYRNPKKNTENTKKYTTVSGTRLQKRFCIIDWENTQKLDSQFLD